MKAFYESRQRTDQPSRIGNQDLLFSDAPPNSSVEIDDDFLDAVRDWLEKHPDIEIESLEDESEVDSSSKHATQRIFTTEDRAWQVIAGHGVDYSRVPKLSFDCLSVIAAHGPRGVFQPALVKITGQDKRSVPKRTDTLAENGYIVKLQAFDGRNKTSLLKLRRFAEPEKASKAITKLDQARFNVEDDLAYTGEYMAIDEAFNQVIRLLKTNNNIVAIVDLCRALKLRKQTYFKKEFMAALKRFEATGCVNEVKALVDQSNNHYTKCLHLVREPTEQDRAAFVGKKTTVNLEVDDGQEVDSAVQENHQNEIDMGEDVAEDDTESDAGSDMDFEQGTSSATQRIPPQWTPDIPLNNFIFKIIDNAGPAGISSMELHRRSMGTFWKKALDDLLLRLTDVWQVSQPKHLEQLSIIRDTEVESRSSHFHFRTRKNFEEAVEMGLTAWEAVMNGKPAKKRGRPKNMTSSEVDEYGFPTLDPKLFAGKDGRASLAECAEPARKSLVRPPSADEAPGVRPQTADSNPSKLLEPDAASTSKRTSLLIDGRKRKVTALQRKGVDFIPFQIPPSEPSKPSTGKKRRRNTETSQPNNDVAPDLDPSPSAERKKPGSKKRKTVETAPTNDDVLATSVESPVQEFSKTGKRKRKDAGIPRGPRKSNATVTDADPNEGQREPDGYGTPDLKRNTTEANLRKSSRTAKTRKMDSDSTSQEPSADDEMIEESALDITARRTVDEMRPHGFGVSFNTPEALTMRFEDYKRPGRRPATNIAIIKSERLKELKCFNPDATALASPVTEHGPQKNALETSEPTTGSPLKKSRLNGGCAMSTAEANLLGVAAHESPSPAPVKRKPGRPPKRKHWKKDTPLQASLSATTDEQLEDSTATPSSIVKLPMPPSSLRQVVQQDVRQDVPTAQSEEISSSIVKLQLPRDKLREIVERDTIAQPADQESPTTTTMPAKDSTGTVLPMVQPSPQNLNRSTRFGLNIFRPYLGSSEPSSPNEDQPTVEKTPDAIDEDYNPLEDVAESSSRGSLPKLFPAEFEEIDGYSQKEIRKSGTPRHGGIIQFRRANIVMETMRKAKGVYPGDREMWYPFTSVWQKTYSHLPDRRTVESTINTLIKQGKLKKWSFMFEDKNGDTIQKHMLTETGILPTSDAVKEVQRAMIDMHPGRYLPKKAYVAPHLRDKARHGSGVTREEDEEDPTFTPTRPKSSKPPPGRASSSLGAGTIATRAANFTPRAILQVQGKAGVAIKTPSKATKASKAAKLSKDVVEIESDNDTDSSDSDDDDEDWLMDISPDQAAMQDSFEVERYSHPGWTAPMLQGKRPMRSFKLGQEVTPVPTPAARKPRVTQPKKSSITIPKDRTFHSPSGTFGTLSVLGDVRKRSGRPTKSEKVFQLKSERLPIPNPSMFSPKDQPFHSPSGTFGTLFAGIEARRRSGRLPNPEKIPAAKSTSLDPVRGSQYRSESKVASPASNFAAPQDLSDILKRANALGCRDADPSDSRLYHAHNEIDRVNAWERAMVVSGRSMEATTETIFINHHLKQPLVSASGVDRDFEFEFVNGTLKPFELEIERGKQARAATARLHYGSVSEISTPQYASPFGMFSARASSTLPKKRPYVYKTRRKQQNVPSVDLAGSASPFVDRDSDTEYRPGNSDSTQRVRSLGSKKNKHRKFSPNEFKRLAIAVALARVLLSGTATMPVTNYEVVALALESKYDLEVVKTQWQAPKKGYYSLDWAKRVEQAMHEPFLEAYANGNVPRVDFDDLANTDWPGLVQWVEVEILPSLGEKPMEELPASRQAIQTVPEAGTGSNARNSDAAADDALSKAPSGLDQEHILEKSWVRAVMIPSDEDYDEIAASDKLRMVDTKLLETIVDELRKTKTITGRVKNHLLPGRSYKISDHVMSQFERWPGPDFLKNVAAARAEFVGHFEQYDQLELRPEITEAQQIALTNMLAQGHLSMAPILPEQNDDFGAPWPKLSKWGQVDLLHDIEQQHNVSPLEMKIVYKKTPLLTPEHGLKLDIAVPREPTPFPNESGSRTPFWVDVKGNVMDDTWEMVLQSIMHLLVHVPGCNTKAIERAHDSKMWEWEIHLVLAWMEEAGVVKKVRPGNEVDGVWKGGWRASEWWYCIFASSGGGNRAAEDVEMTEA